jgi:hypothetical protein
LGTAKTEMAQLVDSMRASQASDEIVLDDHVESFTPAIHGDGAETDIRVRSMHFGVGPRQCNFHAEWNSTVHAQSVPA